MKTINILLFACLFSSILLIENNYAQFLADVRLTNNPAESDKAFNNASSIAAIENYVHVVWHDWRAQALPEIFYKRSTDFGSTWEPDVRLTTFLSSRVYPCVAVSGSVVHVAWQDHRLAGGKIFYKRSADNGSTWGEDIQISHAVDPFSEHPSLSVSGSIVNIVWEDTRNGSSEIYCSRSSDNGINWSPDTRLTVDSAYSYRPAVSASGLDVHVVWVDDRDGNREIYYKNFNEDRIGWGPDIRLTTDSNLSGNPSIFADGSVVYVIWQDVRLGGWEIWGKVSSDGGFNWGDDNRLTNNPSNSFYPAISVYGSNIHVVWSDIRDENWEVYYKLSSDAGLSWSIDTRLTNQEFDSYYPSIAVTDSAVHVVWQDSRDGNDEIYYKRDPMGNLVSVNSNGSAIPESYTLFQNFPNPFNPVTNIRFSVPAGNGNGRFVQLIIYDILGSEVTALVNEQLTPGTYEVNWNASNYSSGIYYYTLQAGDYKDTKKMILLK